MKSQYRVFTKKIYFFYVLCLISSGIKSQTFIEKHLGNGSGTSIIESEDHNLIATVNLYDSGYFHVMKMDTSGATLWSINVGPVSGLTPNNVASDIIKATPNKYLIIGTYDPGIGGYNKVYTILIDSSGNILWENQYSTNNSNGSSAVYDSTNSVFYIVGAANNANADIYISKIDTNGVLLFEKYYDYGADDHATKIKMRNDTDIWIIGGTTSYSLSHSTYDGLIVNIDSNGNEKWVRHYGGNQHEDFNDLFLLDSGAIILGTTMSYGAGNNDAWILRIKENGDAIWTKTYGFSTGDASIDMTYDSSNENFWVVGYSYQGSAVQMQSWIFKMDTLGNILYSTFLGGVENDQLYYTFFSNTSNSLYAFGSTDISGIDSVYFVRLDSANLITQIYSSEIINTLTAFPNPTNKNVYLKMPGAIANSKIELELIDVSGKRFYPLYTLEFEKLSVELPDEKGIYILVLTIDYQKYYSKLIKS